MGVHFGRWSFDAPGIAPAPLHGIAEMLAPYGSERVVAYSDKRIEILHCGLPINTESLREIQPYHMERGAVVLWDGRLDNREELFSRLKIGGASRAETTDVAIVAAAYCKWETACFAKLIGDWAISIWDAKRNHVILAKDPIGTRPMFYRYSHSELYWSSILDPLVLTAQGPVDLEQEYVAGLIGWGPATHLTPYRGIYSVPPSCYVLVDNGRTALKKYWDFDPSTVVRYYADEEYEEHFRVVFQQSIRRRLRSHYPVVAELSGGIDSSSIVCMADSVLASSGAQTPNLETLSYYAVGEPNWDERPYFEKVEEQRGRAGMRIEIITKDLLKFDYDWDRFAAGPSSPGRANSKSEAVADFLGANKSRIVLSGLGGDELLGGVATPIPQLTELLLNGQVRDFSRHVKLWALATRRPVLQLAWNAFAGCLPGQMVCQTVDRRVPEWLNPKFRKRYKQAIAGYPQRRRLDGYAPPLQENLDALEAIRRQLSIVVPPCRPAHQVWYPYLDRDLLEFLFAVPAEQVCRPGHRRSLMRRSLSGIVPAEILNRKRKASVTRAPFISVAAEWTRLRSITENMHCDSFGIVDRDLYRRALTAVRDGQDEMTVPLLRCIGLELWLRHAIDQNVLSRPQSDRQIKAAELKRSKTGLHPPSVLDV